jgi:hypothetical protein
VALLTVIMGTLGKVVAENLFGIGPEEHTTTELVKVILMQIV